MMKKLVILTMVMVLGLAMAASAAMDTDWFLNMRASTDAAAKSNSAGTAKYGTSATASSNDAVAGAEDAKLASYVGTTGVVECIDLGDTLNWAADVRTAIANNTSKTWKLRVWNGDTFTGSVICLVGWNASAGDYDPTADSTALIKLYQVDQYGGARTLLHDFTNDGNGTYGLSTGVSGVYYTTTFAKANQASAWKLELVASGSVPEPGSLLAMLSGMIGLVGYGIRRRK